MLTKTSKLVQITSGVATMSWAWDFECFYCLLFKVNILETLQPVEIMN